MADIFNIAGEINSTSQEGTAVRANQVKDDVQNKKQAVINQEVSEELALHASQISNETIRAEGVEQTLQQQINAITGDKFVTVFSYSLLPVEGEVNTIYRVSYWDGIQVDASKYSEYAWNGTDYTLITVRSAIGEVFNISEYNAVGGQATVYDNLADALGIDGANVPQSVRAGGMSVKFIQGTVHTSDNKYIQARCMAQNFTTDVTQWQGVDDEPTAGSKNLVESDGAYVNKANVVLIQGTNIPFTHRTYVGVSSGTLTYSYHYNNRLMIELPTEYLKACTIINDNYLIAFVALHQDILPTSNFLHYDVQSNTFDFEAACQNISDFVPRHAIVVIKKTDNSDLTDITSVDGIIGFELKENTNISVFKKTVVAVTARTGFPTIEHGKITFLQNTGINIFYLSHPTENIVFNADATFEFDPTKAERLIVRNGEIIMESNNVHLTGDIILLQYSYRIKDFTGGWLYQLYLNNRIDSNIVDVKNNTAILSGVINLPCRIGGVKGVSVNYLEYNTALNCLTIELPSKYISTIKYKEGYFGYVFLYEDALPTAKFRALTITDTLQSNVYIDLQKEINETSGFIPNKVLMCFAKSDNSNWNSEDLKNVYEFFELTNTVNSERVVKKIKLFAGSLQITTGTYSTSNIYYLGYAHTPKFIRINGLIKIKTRGLNGYFYYYDKNQTYISERVAFNTLNDDATVKPYSGAEYFRLAVNQENGGIVPDSIEIECENMGYEEKFQKLPTDSGYTNVTVVVDTIRCTNPSTQVSEIEEQYIKSTDSGVLHLPSNYSHDGKPTPLIIYIHGAADRYTAASKRFAENNSYAPEWDAAGYAQLDMDVMPDMYEHYNVSNNTGSGDDMKCLEAIYDWCINHFNIATDGIYLMGRSRGGISVSQVLGHYGCCNIPIVCAVINAGVMPLLNYRLNTVGSVEDWNLFCDAFNLPSEGRPTYTSGKVFVAQPTIAAYLREYIDIWWDKAMVILPTIINNPTEYQTKLQIFDLMVSSYSDTTNPGKTYCDFIRACSFRSPIPMRYDICRQDSVMDLWTPNAKFSYVAAFKDAIVNTIGGNAEYRLWPSSPSNPPKNPHWHELLNFYNGDYTMSNDVTINDPSMARLEWLLWCQRHDRRYNGSVQPTPVSNS